MKHKDINGVGGIFYLHSRYLSEVHLVHMQMEEEEVFFFFFLFLLLIISFDQLSTSLLTHL